MDLKELLKSLKNNESTISMVLGAFIIVIVGILVINFFKTQRQNNLLPEAGKTTLVDETYIEPVAGKEYVVQEGETLWDIAEKAYGDGFKWTDIAAANDLSGTGVVETGQKISLPSVEVYVPQETPIVDTLETEELALEIINDEEEAETEPVSELETISMPELIDQDSQISGDTYTVVRGDTLWDIAVRAYGDGFRWKEIAEANNLVNPNLIHQGNVFAIPR